MHNRSGELTFLFMMSRPMAIIRYQSDLGEPEIWMATGGRSPKIEEITKESRVNVSLMSTLSNAICTFGELLD